MATISTPGIGSGLDIKSIVPALVDAEIKPNENKNAVAQARTQAEISAIGFIKSSLGSLQSAANDLSTLSGLSTRKATSSNTGVLTLTSDNTASASTYDINVTAIATAQSLSSASFAATTTSIGYGDLNISIGDYNGTFTTTTVSIDSGADTLADIKQAINDANAGVTASIIFDGSGYKLNLVSDKTGLANQIKITVSNDGDTANDDNAGLSQLAYDKTLSSPQSNLTQNIAALDSALTINGIGITSSSNTLTDNIDGLTLNLKTIGTSIVKVSNDTSSVKSKITTFIKNFNDTIATLKDLSKYDATTKKAGVLQGDFLPRTLMSQLRDALYSEVNYITGNYKTITDLGITTDSNNKLVIDDAKLQSALDDNFNDVAYLFARGAYTTDGLMEVNSQGSDVAAGVYSVTLDSGTIGSGTLTGTIGGVAATASDGVELEGSGAYSSLSINVLGGILGTRGNIIVFDGLSKKLNDLIDDYIGTDGSVNSRLSLLDDKVKSLSTESNNLAIKRQSLEEKYFLQYSQLDGILAQLQGTTDYLTSALEGISGSTKK